MANQKKEPLSKTKASEKVQQEILQYQEYWRKAKNGANPEVVRISKEQMRKLGVSSGFVFYGSRLEAI